MALKGVGKMSDKVKAIIIDLDGTLCNNEHRKHFIEGDKKDFDAFNVACTGDTRNEWCYRLAFNMSESYEILLVSGREDKYIEETRTWLNKNFKYIGYTLYMRKAGDYRKDSEIKEEIYKQQIEPRFDVLFCVDDRQQVVDMWRSIGLTCLQCAKGDF